MFATAIPVAAILPRVAPRASHVRLVREGGVLVLQSLAFAALLWTVLAAPGVLAGAVDHHSSPQAARRATSSGDIRTSAS